MIGACFPQRAPGGEPPLRFGQPAADQLAGARAAVFPGLDEAAALEHRNVLHERRPRHVERRGQFRHGPPAAAECVDDRAARRIGEGVEDVVDAGAQVSHAAKYGQCTENFRRVG